MSETVMLAIITGATGILGSLVGSIGGWLVAGRTARIEERKHFRELGLKVALTKFESRAKLAQQLADVTGKFQEIPPLETFVIEGVKFMDIVATPDLNAQATARRLAELRDFHRIIIQAAKQPN